MQRGGRGIVSYDGGKIAGLYDLEATLGRGHFAVVKLARHVFTGEKVAVKVIDKNKLDDVSRAHLFQEVRCMKLVQHPNVVRLYEVIDTATKLYLVLELGDGGDLYDYIMRTESGLSEVTARDYFAQIVTAIAYCHRLHVVHRDLKPENVVFFERLGIVKLTDFGFSNRFCPGQKLETSCGSLAYSAPEILLGDSYDAPAVDVWSLGVILYMLVCGQAPFQEANDSETLTMIMDCKYHVPSHVSEPCRNLIGRMLVREPEKRASLQEIATDPWLLEAAGAQSELSLPLVSRQHISDEDHAIIVQKMVNGKIATKEEILDALDKNEYNHISATYFLLAERKLRALGPRHHMRTTGRHATPMVRVDSCKENEVTSPTGENRALLGMPQATGDVSQRGRKCSIVAEEEDEEEERAGGMVGELCGPGGLNRRGSRSEGKLHLAVQELRGGIPISVITEACTAPGPLHPSPATPSPRPYPHGPSTTLSKTLPAPLPTALSSPQLGLGGISEEGVSVSGGAATRPAFVPPSYEQSRAKLRKTRTASCSSSDASDEDSEGRKKRQGSNRSLQRGRDGPDDRNGGDGGGNCGPGGAAPLDGAGHGTVGGGPGGCSAGGSDSLAGTGGTTNSGNSRHRRRSGETRLRESQSLNRITEVQEGEAGTLPSTAPPPSPTSDPTPSLPVAPPPSPVPSAPTKRSSNPLLGRYLSLQRKLCLPSLWGKSRHYKAQVVSRKDINQNLGSAAVAVAASIGMCHLHMGESSKCCSYC